MAMSLLFLNRSAGQRLLTLVLLGGVLLFLPRIPQAAEWSIRSSIDQFLGYDTNVRMRQIPQGSFLYKIIPVVSFKRETDVSEITADVLYGTQRYSDISGFDQDIQNYSLGGLYKTERFDWGFTANYSITPTRNSITQNAGNFNTASENISRTISPSLTYKANETNTLTLTPSYNDLSFTNAAASKFRNSNTININLAWQHLWSERYNSSVSMFYSIFESLRGNTGTQRNVTYDSYGVNISNEYTWTEKWKLSGTFGGRITDSNTSTAGSSASLGFLADVTVDYTGDRFSSAINFQRSLAPSFQGFLQQQTSAGWDIKYKISETLSASFNANILESTIINSATGQKDRQYISFQPVIAWKLSPDWTLSGSYRYRTQDRAQDSLDNATQSKSADSNLIMLTLNYNWQGLKLSR